MQDDPFEIAVEHIAHCIATGKHVDDVFAAIGERPPQNAGWRDAIWAIAKAQDELSSSPAPRRAHVAVRPRPVPARVTIADNAVMPVAVVAPVPRPEPGTQLFN